MTDTTGGQLPGVPDDFTARDELADLIRAARREYLQGQVLLRAHRETMPENPEGRARLEEYLDQIADTIRRESSALAVRVLEAVQFTGFGRRQARHLLIATGADDAVLANFDDHPEEMTRTLTAFIADPAPLDVKLAMIAEADPGAVPRKPEDA